MRNKIFFTFLVLALFSCGKKVSDNNHPELIGNWSADDNLNYNLEKINISDDAYGSYYSQDRTRFRGIVRVKGNDFWIGDHKFHIDVAPHTNLTLDSAFYSQNPTYVKPAIEMTVDMPFLYKNTLFFFKER